jgi:hypothetical protein
MKPKQPESSEPEATEPWMSHHTGKVTGTNVPPGAGDEEAGLTGDDPPLLEGEEDYGTPAYSVLDGAGFGFSEAAKETEKDTRAPADTE